MLGRLFSPSTALKARWRDTRRKKARQLTNSRAPGVRDPDVHIRRLSVGLDNQPAAPPAVVDRPLAKLKMMKLYHYIQNLHALGGVVQVTGDETCNRWLFKALYQILRESSDSTFWLRTFWQVIDGANFTGPNRLLIENTVPQKFVDENAQYDLLLLMQNDVEVRV